VTVRAFTRALWAERPGRGDLIALTLIVFVLWMIVGIPLPALLVAVAGWLLAINCFVAWLKLREARRATDGT